MANTYMFEVYYAAPVDDVRETRVSAVVTKHGGRLDFHEGSGNSGPIILTKELSATGEHVEVSGAYGTAD